MVTDKSGANILFRPINKLYGQTLIIITPSKGPDDGGKLLSGLAIITAILDRIIHKSEIIHLSGDSYRIKHQETIFRNI